MWVGSTGVSLNGHTNTKLKNKVFRLRLKCVCVCVSLLNVLIRFSNVRKVTVHRLRVDWTRHWVNFIYFTFVFPNSILMEYVMSLCAMWYAMLEQDSLVTILYPPYISYSIHSEMISIFGFRQIKLLMLISVHQIHMLFYASRNHVRSEKSSKNTIWRVHCSHCWPKKTGTGSSLVRRCQSQWFEWRFCRGTRNRFIIMFMNYVSYIFDLFTFLLELVSYFDFQKHRFES